MGGSQRGKVESSKLTTYREQSSAVGCDLDNLKCRVVSRIHCPIRGKWDLRQADRARVRAVGRAQDLERRHQRVGHVYRATVRPISADADVDVKKCRLMALEPARLKGYCAARCRPVCSILCQSNAAACICCQSSRLSSHAALVEGELRAWVSLTWIGPLHAIRPRLIRM